MRFAEGGEAFVAGLGDGFAADRGGGGHVEQVARVEATATDAAVAAVLAGVAVEGGEAEQGGRLAAVEAAEFGHVGTEAGGIDGAEAGDRADDGSAVGERGVGGDAGLHAGIAVGDGGAQSVDGRMRAGGGLGIEFGTELAEGVELADELAAAGEQVAEQGEVARPWQGRAEVLEQAEASEHGGIDAVVFGELAEVLGEAPGAPGVDENGVDAGVGEALVQVAVVAAGGFEDGAGDTVLEQPVAQGAAAALVVAELAVETALEDVGVELGLADVDAGEDNGVGCSHSCVPILLRFGASPTLPSRARRNCCDGPTKLQHGSGNPRRTRSDPSPPVGPGQGGICYLPQRWLAPPAALGRGRPR